MKLAQPRCPICSGPAVATLDIIKSRAYFDGDPSACEVMYSGENDVDWNSQAPEKENGKPLVTCDNDHIWATDIEGLEDAQ